MTTVQTTALIADDEPHLLQALQKQLLALWPDLHIVAVARNGIEAAQRITALQPDIAFLDIQMPGLTGLEVAQGIEGQTRVVFVTAYDEYAVQAFDQAALDYVLKPIKPERLQRTIDRVRAALLAPASPQEPTQGAALLAALQRLLPAAAATTSTERLRWVRASRGEVTQQIAVQDVLVFHADDKYTCVRTAAAEHLIRTPIIELAAQLDPAVFQQIHRSTLINLQHMESTRRDETSRLFVRMRGQKEELPVSRAYVHLFKAM
jgi:DNA-binding LytR/AlgR family response regulator